MEEQIDTGYAPEKWAFDDEVTRVFDNMLERSIPQYWVMRQACYDIGLAYVQPDTDVVDLGCSRGEAIVSFLRTCSTRNRFVGLDVSKPMLEASRERFKELMRSGTVDIIEHDLRQGYPNVRSSLTLAVLTLMFTPIEYRQRIVQNVYDSLTPGGAFILVEKILGASATIAQQMIDIYHAFKAENGYSLEEIERKRLSLEGVQVPITAHWNEELLKNAGFTSVDCFWRWMNFAGWIAIK